MTYYLMRTIRGHPGYGEQYHTTSYPNRDVVVSRHRLRARAKDALLRAGPGHWVEDDNGVVMRYREDWAWHTCARNAVANAKGRCETED